MTGRRFRFNRLTPLDRWSGDERCWGEMAKAATDPETIVREFCAAWRERSIDDLLTYFTDDALYHNMLSRGDSN